MRTSPSSDPLPAAGAAPRFVPVRRPAAPPDRATSAPPVAPGRPASAPSVPDSTRAALWRDLGMLAEYADERTTDLLLTGPVLWADRGDGLEPRHDWPVLDEPSLRELAVRLVARGGRHLDDGSPCVDVRLAEGIRVHAVLPPVSAGGTLVSVRLPARRRWRLQDLAAAGSLDDTTVQVLREAVRDRQNILLTGGAGTGKTTLLAAILA